MTDLPPDVLALLREGHKLQAVQRLRETGLSLDEARARVEAAGNAEPAHVPETPSGVSGGRIILAGFVLVAVTVVALVWLLLRADAG